MLELSSQNLGQSVNHLVVIPGLDCFELSDRETSEVPQLLFLYRVAHWGARPSSDVGVLEIGQWADQNRWAQNSDRHSCLTRAEPANLFDVEEARVIHEG